MYNMLSNPPDRLSVLQDVQSTVRQLQQHLITHGHHAEALLQGDTFRGVLVNKETTPREHINLALLAEQAMATAIVFYGIVPDVEGKGQLLLTRVVWPDQDTVELHQRPIDLGSLADVVKAGRPQRVETAHQEARQADDSANETANSELLVPLESLINGCRLRDKATRDGSAPGPALDQAGQTTSKSASRGTDGEAAAEAAEALATTRQALTNLRKVLIPPSVEDVIATCDPGDPHDAPSIVFVPHQALHLVPFSALLSPDGIPLIAQCEVSCVPSLHALQTCFDRHQQVLKPLPTVINQLQHRLLRVPHRMPLLSATRPQCPRASNPSTEPTARPISWRSTLAPAQRCLLAPTLSPPTLFLPSSTTSRTLSTLPHTACRIH
eukprot:m.471352 g.471352  ORF g.471352 m.471352 type:complete len:382 (-) comp20375_c2_seq9:710-1855(-)